MFSRSFKQPTESFSKHRASKTSSVSKSRKPSSFKERSFTKRPPADLDLSQAKQHGPQHAAPTQAQLNSTVVTISVGHAPARLFAAHVDVLNTSPFFQSALHSHFYASDGNAQLAFPMEVPEVFSCVLEYLYKGDYTPKLVSRPATTKHGQTVWSLEADASIDNTVWISASIAPASPTIASPHPTDSSNGMGVYILKDTAIYCAAERFGLPLLKRLALRKQGLQSGVPVSTILASARYAYANTPDNDRHLRAHYLALIIRSRNTFKRSGTMQAEMSGGSPKIGSPGGEGGLGTELWFDLFVAMCNHLDDIEMKIKESPRH